MSTVELAPADDAFLYVLVVIDAVIVRPVIVTGFGAGDSRGSGGFLYNVALRLLLGRRSID
jgi:hypothetical protein